MKIAFFSNYLNHHQAELCEAFYKETKGEFRFIACEPISDKRLSLGYQDMDQRPYVIRIYEGAEQQAEADHWCLASDVIIHGAADEIYISRRLKDKLPVFRYTERLLKKGAMNFLTPGIYKNFLKYYLHYNHKPLFLLCASAYTAMDFYRIGAYKGKAYRWGYFPAVKRYSDVNEILRSKKKNSLLWVARFIDLKHPEVAITVAEKLKKEGYDFTLSMIGAGPKQKWCEKIIKRRGLSDVVQILGSMSPEQVREHMEQSEIFLFTSDRNEGWGAVLNESMNSACAVVASHIIGSVPFLIKDNQNGLIYRNGHTQDLYEKVKFLLDNPSQRECIGRAAYGTLCDHWNAEEAAKRFIQLAQAVSAGDETPDLFADDVCSKAPLLKDNWY